MNNLNKNLRPPLFWGISNRLNPFKKRHGFVFVLLFGILTGTAPAALGVVKDTVTLYAAARPSEKNQPTASHNSGPVLIEATMCEEIKDGLPVNRAILFSLEKGRVICFSTFGDITEETTIFHKWYFRDKLIYRIKLALRPPRWSTYSNIKLRDTDRGPWRVEITDHQNHVYHILRFSITD